MNHTTDARAEISKILKAHGVTMTGQAVSKRTDRLMREPNRKGSDLRAHYEFDLHVSSDKFDKKWDARTPPSGNTLGRVLDIRDRLRDYHEAANYSGTYSSGVLAWIEDYLKQPPRFMDGRKALREYKRTGFLSVDANDAIQSCRMKWAPDICDIVAAMVSDCVGWPIYGLDFCEWIEEGIAPENAADAHATWQAIDGEHRWLLRVFGEDGLDQLRELAGEP